MYNSDSVALWISIGVHIERFRVQTPDSLKKFVVFIQYYYRGKN